MDERSMAFLKFQEDHENIIKIYSVNKNLTYKIEESA